MINSGICILESIYACTYVRNRTYAKRRARSPRHWERIDKKWRKRFGFHVEPHAYMSGTDTLIVHPLLATQYRAAINDVFQQYPGENRL